MILFGFGSLPRWSTEYTASTSSTGTRQSTVTWTAQTWITTVTYRSSTQTVTYPVQGPYYSGSSYTYGWRSHNTVNTSYISWNGASFPTGEGVISRYATSWASNLAGYPGTFYRGSFVSPDVSGYSAYYVSYQPYSSTQTVQVPVYGGYWQNETRSSTATVTYTTTFDVQRSRQTDFYQ